MKKCLTSGPVHVLFAGKKQFSGTEICKKKIEF